MSTAPARGSELARQIEAAWADAAYPGDDRLVPLHMIEPQGGKAVECDECRETRAALRGLRWQDVRPRALELFDTAGPASLALLSPEAFGYYLPAALLACLLEYERADTLPGAVATSLIPSHDPKLAERHRRRLSALSPPQRRAAAGFMAFLKEAHGDDLSAGVYDFDAAIRALSA